MEQFLIVDGYNMIGAWPQLQMLRDVSLEEARDRLIDMLAEYQAFSGVKVVLVFDAYQVPGLGKEYRQNRLRVLYTKEKETADELIERLVTELIARRRQIYVATSDMMEQHVIFGLGAFRLTASELLTRIRQGRKEIQHKIKRPALPERNTLDSRIDPSLLAKLEKMRRGE
ncbi:RNA-binding protein [Gordoniibacillus kamchatkensis]|uniref:RNA-binding protein n=1 Tax=Gordoniibacillus kamchatkensis TaxID=1590651 RepID=A0ABR5ABG6_9BACL|nr:NYN domain-containing protein [Paenibacillus sp. VKM B-2647]KIL38396.1 RNA-binding protein [Paenibacillus sp. VKM B-2647]